MEVITFAAYLLVFLLALLLGARSVSRHHPALRQDAAPSLKRRQS
ncbi:MULTISPECIES: hypothetical protein [Cupriavidus]|nr:MULTISPECIES: hypothetical protein [Cupriavidus]